MKARRSILILLIACLTRVTLAGAPQSPASAGTARPGPAAPVVTDIPIRSLEVITMTRQAFQDLVPASTIRQRQVRNKQILASVDTSLLRAMTVHERAQNIRFLENRKVRLQQELEKINQEEAGLNAILYSLDTLTTWLRKESALWRNTLGLAGADSSGGTFTPKITSMIAFLDSAVNIVSVKTRAVMGMLDLTLATGVTLDLRLEKVSSLIAIRERNALASDHIPFFHLDFRTNYGTEVTGSFDNLYKVRLKELKHYVGYNLGQIVGIFILFMLMVWLFRGLRRRIHVNMEGIGRFYKEMFLLMLSNPLEIALILAMVSSSFLFFDRPMIFRELQTYIIAIPLVILLNRVLQGRYRPYLWGFIAIIAAYMVIVLVSPETVLYRLIMILIPVAEATVLAMVAIRFRKTPGFSPVQRNVVMTFLVLHFVLAVSGLAANLSGRITLAEITINAVFVNILNGVILFISMLVLNGLTASVVDSRWGRRMNTLRIHGEKIKLRAIRIISLLAAAYWVNLMLVAFHLDDYVYGLIGSVMTHKFSLGTAAFSFDMVLLFFVVLFIAYYLARYLQVLLEEDILNRMPLSKGLPHTIAMGLKYTLITLGFLLALNTTGIPMDKVTIILGAFSVGIGFGLQNIFNNMVSGLILLFERPIQLGDTIQVGQLTGDVKSIDLRSSNIHTFDGAEVIVPNSQLVSNEVINWTLSDKKRRLEIPVGVGYDSDPQQVHDLLTGVLRGHPKVLTTPEPLVLFSALGDSSLDFVLLFWIADYIEGRIIKSDVLFSVFRVLREAGVKIPYPQREVHLKTEGGIKE